MDEDFTLPCQKDCWELALFTHWAIDVGKYSMSWVAETVQTKSNWETWEVQWCHLAMETDIIYQPNPEQA